MKFNHVLKALGPVLAIALAVGVSGCNGARFSINGDEGKKLSELDLTGKTPSKLVLLGPDEVRLTQGDRLAISVEGDPEVVEHMRFTLDGEALGILRENKSYVGSGRAVVHVTMPAPREVTMAGSGTIIAPALAPDAKVTVAGSGNVDAGTVSGASLEVNLPGSGDVHAVGTVERLELNILGSGSARLDAVKVAHAKVSIAGSGDATFASDGDVAAAIMGSGSVRVKGRARCTLSGLGSGEIICEGPVEKSGVARAKDAPEPPEAPETGQ